MMFPNATIPAPSSKVNLLAVLFPLFTAPSFRTFCGLACGFLAQTGKRTVCGMLTGAGLSQVWPHDRAHWFFSRARWNPDELGIAVAKLVVALLVPAGEPVTVAIDDTLFKRRGKKVWAFPLVHHQDPALHRRHGRQAPPRYHRRSFSPISPRPANTRRNRPHPPGLGRPRRITSKVEV
jgi:hypothetical protein